MNSNCTERRLADDRCRTHPTNRAVPWSRAICPPFSRVHRTIASGGGHSFHNGRLAKFAWPLAVALTRWMSEMPATITAWVGTANKMARVTE